MTGPAPPPGGPRRVRLRLDGREVEAVEGTSLLEVARARGIELPGLCAPAGLPAQGTCGVCAVEVVLPPQTPARGSHTQAEASNEPRVASTLPACTTPAREGLEVRTAGRAPESARRVALERILHDHPLDCPVCPRSGDCPLQELALALGASGGPSVPAPPPNAAGVPLGAGLRLLERRCIGCGLCVAFTRLVDGAGELSAVERDGRRRPEAAGPLRSPLAGNLVDLCPAGAILFDRPPAAPPWTETSVASVCPGCATGCSVELRIRGDRIARARPRHHPDVNGPWICDRGRREAARRAELRREREPRPAGAATPREAAWHLVSLLRAAVGAHGPETVGAVASARWTLEALELLRVLLESLGVPPGRVAARGRPAGPAWTGAGGFRIAADRDPNRAGVRLVLGSGAFERAGPLLEDVHAGRVRTLLVASDLPGRRLEPEWIEALRRAEQAFVFSLETEPRLPERAVRVPATAFAERTGAVVNDAGRLQLARAAVPRPAGVPDEIDVLQEALRLLGLRRTTAPASAVFEELTAGIPGLEGLRHLDLGTRGVPLPAAARAGAAPAVPAGPEGAP